MLYLPVAFRHRSRSWIYEVTFILWTYFISRSLLSDMTTVTELDDFAPYAVAKRYHREIDILVGADFCVFLVDFWRYAIWPLLTGVRPDGQDDMEWPWWAWILEPTDLAVKAANTAVHTDALLSLMAIGEIGVIIGSSHKPGPPALATSELLYFIGFVFMRLLLMVGYRLMVAAVIILVCLVIIIGLLALGLIGVIIVSIAGFIGMLRNRITLPIAAIGMSVLGMFVYKYY